MPAKISKQKKVLLAASGLVAAYLLMKKDVPEPLKNAVGAVTNAVRDMSLPRGLRNNNPFNLRKGVAWLGRNGDDGAFDIFTSMEYGIRAGLQNFKTQHKKGYNTVSKLLNRWAPVSDGNNTKAYIDFVCKTVPISANEKINLADKTTLAGILYAMAQQENGIAITKQKLALSTVQAVVNQY